MHGGVSFSFCIHYDITRRADHDIYDLRCVSAMAWRWRELSDLNTGVGISTLQVLANGLADDVTPEPVRLSAHGRCRLGLGQSEREDAQPCITRA